MKYRIKTLSHNGIYVPEYELKGLKVKLDGRIIPLGKESEKMVVAMIKRNQNTLMETLFFVNFMNDFFLMISHENPSLRFLGEWYVKYSKTLHEKDQNWISEGGKRKETDFSEVLDWIKKEQEKKENMTKEEKKKLREERKAKRETLKNKYGYAILDGRKVEIGNWIAEPSCIFVGRGEHPKRGSWKESPTEKDIILNLSPNVPIPSGDWKAIVWEPEKMYIAKWRDKLSGKIKYVQLSDSAFLKQQREQEKFKKAKALNKRIEEIEMYIRENMRSEEEERRKIATVCFLIFSLNMRVGDEKDADEADTVGAITLRPKHITIKGPKVSFDFLGKDAVRWQKEMIGSKVFVSNLAEFSESCKEYLFEGINSKKVSKFLSEKMEGLTAKLFRIWKCSTKVKDYLDHCKVKKEDSEFLKRFYAKEANLVGAIECNHKRKIPLKFDERLENKKLKLNVDIEKLKEITRQGKKTDAILRRIQKKKLDIQLTEETKEWTLGTSLKSYIDPSIYVRWAKKVDFSLNKLYSKSLQKKYSWIIGDENN